MSKQDTPLEALHSKGVLEPKHWEESKDNLSNIVNLSDAIRLALIDKLGGWYCDLDIVFLQGLQGLTNAVAADEFDPDLLEQDPQHLGTSIANGMFHFEKGHPFLKKCMDIFASNFKAQEWGSGGPQVFKRAFMQLCNLQRLGDVKQCQGVTRLNPR